MIASAGAKWILEFKCNKISESTTTRQRTVPSTSGWWVYYLPTYPSFKQMNVHHLTILPEYITRISLQNTIENISFRIASLWPRAWTQAFNNSNHSSRTNVLISPIKKVDRRWHLFIIDRIKPFSCSKWSFLYIITMMNVIPFTSLLVGIFMDIAAWSSKLVTLTDGIWEYNVLPFTEPGSSLTM